MSSSPRISHIALTTSIMSLLAIVVSTATFVTLMQIYGDHKMSQADHQMHAEHQAPRAAHCWVGISVVAGFVLLLVLGLVGATRKSICLLRFFWVMMTLKLVVSVSLAIFFAVLTFVLIPNGWVPTQMMHGAKPMNFEDIMTAVENNPLPFVGHLILALLSFILHLRCIVHARILIAHIAAAHDVDEVELSNLPSSSDEEMVFEPRPVDAYPAYMVPQGIYAQQDGNVYLMPVDSSHLVPVYVDRNGLTN